MSAQRSDGDGMGGVVVRRGPLSIAVAVVPGRAAMDAGRLREILGELAEQRGARHLIAYAGQPSAATRTAAAESGAVLWDRERLAAEAGAAFVGTADPDAFAGPLEAAAEFPEATSRPARAQRGWPTAGPAARTIVPVRAPDVDSLLGAVPRHLDEGAARAAAERLLKSTSLRAALEWVPLYLMDFHVEVDVRTPRGHEALLHSGSMLVSASGGEVEELDGPVELVETQAVLSADELARALARKRLTVGDARERARAQALADAVRTVETVREGAAAVVMERHAWRPKGSHVDLVVRGLLVVPMWLVETDHGLASISGATGRALRVAPFAGEPSLQGA